MEKFLELRIVMSPRFKYKVCPGACVLEIDKQNIIVDQVIAWLYGAKGKELLDTWAKYDYFVDDDGDISRKLK